MAWSIIKKGGPGKIPTYREFIVDTVADIATLPIVPELPAGCKAYCSANGSTYVLETDGDWVLKTTGTNTANVNDLKDVDITNVNNGQILSYNSSSQKWENEDIPEELPAVTAADNGAFLGVNNGVWSKVVPTGNSLVVTFSKDGSDYVCDKTVAEIVAAVDAGKNITAYESVDDYTAAYSGITTDDSNDETITTVHFVGVAYLLELSRAAVIAINYGSDGYIEVNSYVLPTYP